MKLYEAYCYIRHEDRNGDPARGIIVGPWQWTWGSQVTIHHFDRPSTDICALYVPEPAFLPFIKSFSCAIKTRQFFLEVI